MNSKAVNIYAYSDTRGVFFYNGNNASRDTQFDALTEDSKTSLKPKYEGYKLKDFSGIGAEETEIFTSPMGVGDGVFITGKRIPEKYIDLTAVGAGSGSVKDYYQYAKNFHVPGEWYYLNIQIHNTWVKVKAMLKHYKITPDNVYKRVEVTASWMIPDVTSDTYWHDSFDASKIPAVAFTAASSSADLVSPVIDVVDMDTAGWPVLKYTLYFPNGAPTHADSSAHKIKGAPKLRYYNDAGVLTEATLTNGSPDIYYNGNYLFINGYGYQISEYEIDYNCEFYLLINTNPSSRYYKTKAKLKKLSTGTYTEVSVRNSTSFTNIVPGGKKIEDFQMTINKNDIITGSVSWEAA